MPEFKRICAIVAATAAIATVGACGSDSSGGSSGGKTVSTGELATKLSQEPEYKQFITFLSKGKTDSKTKAQAKAFTDCIAEAVHKAIPDAKLRDYVDGKRTLKNIATASQLKSQEAATKACLQQNVPK